MQSNSPVPRFFTYWLILIIVELVTLSHTVAVYHDLLNKPQAYELDTIINHGLHSRMEEFGQHNKQNQTNHIMI